MSLILYGCVAPVLVAIVVWMRTGSHLESRDAGARPLVSDLPATSSRLTAARWEGLTEEIARRGNRRPPRSDDAALRRRHLAAVLPADARR